MCDFQLCRGTPELCVMISGRETVCGTEQVCECLSHESLHWSVGIHNFM